jgi:hypothetical protein
MEVVEDEKVACAKAALEARLRQEFEGQFGNLTMTLPNLYHYTTGEGLKGVLQTKRIWATHYKYVNDSSEFDYGRVIARETIQRVSVETRHAVVDKMLDELQAFIEAEKEASEHYVARFCGTGDLLSQWRGYANSGIGYAILLSPTRMKIALPDLSGQINQNGVKMQCQWAKLSYEDPRIYIEAFINDGRAAL